MATPEINTIPPAVCNADGDPSENGGQVGYFVKMVVIQMIQAAIANRKGISEWKKLILYIILFIGLFYKSNQEFVEKRPLTLYDHFNITRAATFEEIKAGKQIYLEALNNIANDTFKGNKT